MEIENGRSDLYERLERELRVASAVAVLESLLKDVDANEASGILPTQDASDLRVEIFRRLQQETDSDPKTASRLIEGWLLPLSVGRAGGKSEREAHTDNLLRERIVSWLEQYDEQTSALLRDRVLNWLGDRLGPPTLRDACWTIGAIGYRRSDIVQMLWEQAERDDGPGGEAALATLSGMGVPIESRERLLTALHSRLKAGCTTTLLDALRRLADQSSVPVVLSACLQGPGVSPNSIETWMSLGLLANIAGSTDDNEVSDRIWKIISDLFERAPEGFVKDLYLRSDVASRCNSPNVVPAYLGWLRLDQGESEGQRYRRYLVYTRLSECVRPRQLPGWADPHSSEASVTIVADFVRDTQNHGQWGTVETRLKELAWKTLLRLGYPNAINQYETAIAAETNDYLRYLLTESFSCFRLDSLPKTVLDWVVGPFDPQSDMSSSEWLARLAAIAVAQSNPTRESFEALTNFGLTVRGEVLQQSVNALADVSVELIRSRDENVLRTLLHMAANAPLARHQRVAAGALEIISMDGLLSADSIDALVPMVGKNDEDVVVRSTLISTLSHTPSAATHETALHLLRSLAIGADEILRWRSLEALARIDRLPLDDPQYTKILGLERSDSWRYVPHTNHSDWQASIIGLLYRHHRNEFSSLVAEVIRTAEWRSVVKVAIHLLPEIGGRPGPPVSSEVVRSVVDRVRTRQSPTYSETQIFGMLAQFAPDTLAREHWGETWDNWRPEARAALASALGGASYTSQVARMSAESNLLGLVSDSQYPVRRAAFRSLFRQWPSTAAGMTTVWSTMAGRNSRQMAAEACAWDNGAVEQSETVEILEGLIIDEEPDVRQTAARAKRERRDRLWAEDYLQRVLSVEDNNNQAILAAWRFGDALAQIGDDDCVDQIRHSLAVGTQPAHHRQWLARILKEVSEHWEEVTRSWPEPWIEPKGTVSESEGQLAFPGLGPRPAHFTLWAQVAPTRYDKSEWGGVARFSSPVLVPSISDSKCEIFLADGRRGAALMTSMDIPTLEIFLQGTGTFPS